MKNLMSALGGASVALLLVLGGATDARAQAVDVAEAGSWLPWIGCWEAMPDTPAEAEEEAMMLCVRPAEGVAVEMVSVLDGAVQDVELLAADGTSQEIDTEGCSGWQTASFSTDGSRIHLESEYLCDGQVERTTTGLIAMVSPGEWIDVQVADVGGRDMAWVQRYRRASLPRVQDAGFGDLVDDRSMAVRTARFHASAAPGVEAVIETSRHVHPEAVKAWIAEANAPLDLNAQALATMADAGVDPEVIDVAVAVSYPERFALSGASEVEPAGTTTRSYGSSYGMGNRMYYGSWGWNSYRYRYNRFYGPRGYGGWGYGYSPRIIVVRPSEPGTSGGRMIKGRGYVPGSGSSEGSARPRTSPNGGSSASSSSGSSGRGSATRSGTRSGSSSSTGRKAKKRTGGGGGDDGSGGDGFQLR